MPDHISTHFSLAELTATSQRGPDGNLLTNVPDEVAEYYLAKLAWTILEPIRDLLGCPMNVSSGFRGLLVERAVQEGVKMIAPGAPLAPSQHLLGQAADVEPLGAVSIPDAYAAIYSSQVPYDQLLLEGPPGHQWIHVSCAPDSRGPRRMALTSSDGLNFRPYV